MLAAQSLAALIGSIMIKGSRVPCACNRAGLIPPAKPREKSFLLRTAPRDLAILIRRQAEAASGASNAAWIAHEISGLV